MPLNDKFIGPHDKWVFVGLGRKPEKSQALKAWLMCSQKSLWWVENISQSLRKLKWNFTGVIRLNKPVKRKARAAGNGFLVLPINSAKNQSSPELGSTSLTWTYIILDWVDFRIILLSTDNPGSFLDLSQPNIITFCWPFPFSWLQNHISSWKALTVYEGRGGWTHFWVVPSKARPMASRSCVVSRSTENSLFNLGLNTMPLIWNSEAINA